MQSLRPFADLEMSSFEKRNNITQKKIKKDRKRVKKSLQPPVNHDNIHHRGSAQGNRHLHPKANER